VPNVAYPKAFRNQKQQQVFNVVIYHGNPDSKQGQQQQIVTSNKPEAELKLTPYQQIQDVPELTQKKKVSEDARTALPVEPVKNNKDQIDSRSNCINQDGTHICPGKGLKHVTVVDEDVEPKKKTGKTYFY